MVTTPSCRTRASDRPGGGVVRGGAEQVGDVYSTHIYVWPSHVFRNVARTSSSRGRCTNTIRPIAFNYYLVLLLLLLLLFRARARAIHTAYNNNMRVRCVSGATTGPFWIRFRYDRAHVLHSLAHSRSQGNRWNPFWTLARRRPPPQPVGRKSPSFTLHTRDSSTVYCCDKPTQTPVVWML